jgi:TPR repeat protein
LLFNLNHFTIHPDLKRQQVNFAKDVKNDNITLKALYQAKNINTTRDNDTYNLKWYTQSAKQGYVSAQNNLGWLYSKTTTEFHSETKAYMWWFIAAQNGSQKALENMVRMETRLAPDNISKAQNMAEKCLQSDYQTCD